MKLNTNIRHEEPRDYHIVEEITREAFWNLYVPGCDEHLLVHYLRKHPDFIPELSFVIELDGRVVGSIFYSRSKVVDDQGNIFNTITFGPVSILPDLHNKGLGSQLIIHSINKAKKLGYSGIIIGGFPHNYKPYGFIGAKKYQISLPDGKYYTGIMALPLFDGALNDVRGSVYFSEVMEVDQSKLEEYDRLFPKKEKKVTASQLEFEKAVSEIDDQNYI